MSTCAYEYWMVRSTIRTDAAARSLDGDVASSQKHAGLLLAPTRFIRVSIVLSYKAERPLILAGVIRSNTFTGQNFYFHVSTSGLM
jgi:hypothetical protein